jgi:hypothetical protein
MSPKDYYDIEKQNHSGKILAYCLAYALGILFWAIAFNFIFKGLNYAN